jgi:hypothetical protein
MCEKGAVVMIPKAVLYIYACMILSFNVSQSQP